MIVATSCVIVFVDIPIMHLSILQYFSCCSFTIMHLVCSLQGAIECLNYRPQQDIYKLSPRVLCSSLIMVLSTYRTTIAGMKGTSVPNTGVRAHIVKDRNHATKLFNMSSHLTKRQERIVWVAVEYSGLSAIIGCLRCVCRWKKNMESLDKMLVRDVEARIGISSAKLINIFLLYITLF